MSRTNGDLQGKKTISTVNDTYPTPVFKREFPTRKTVELHSRGLNTVNLRYRTMGYFQMVGDSLGNGVGVWGFHGFSLLLLRYLCRRSHLWRGFYGPLSPDIVG